jgi:hypothetical protein
MAEYRQASCKGKCILVNSSLEFERQKKNGHYGSILGQAELVGWLRQQSACLESL